MGAGLSDVGKHRRAEVELRAALALAGDDGRQRAWSLTVLGRTQLLCGDLDEAETTLVAATGITREERWTGFLPYPESLLGDVYAATGRFDLAAEALEHAFTLGCSVNDACWESYSARGLGVLAAARGDLGAALGHLDDALLRCQRERDTHRWIHAYVTDARCAVAIAAGDPRAASWTADLAAMAGAGGMTEFAVRAYLYRHELGEPGALDAARTLASGIENPHLEIALDAGVSPLLAELVRVRG